MFNFRLSWIRWGCVHYLRARIRPRRSVTVAAAQRRWNHSRFGQPLFIRVVLTDAAASWLH